MTKKIVIAGGTGFIGNFFSEKFKKSGYDIVIISRNKFNVNWKDHEAILNAVDNAEMVINLAGKSVDCRYNKKNKEEILNSRINTTKAIGDAITKCKHPPELWINSSTATIYRHAEDRPMTEISGEIGKGFSVAVAKAWESAFFSYKLPNTKQVALRMAIVLGKDGGVMKPLMNLVRFGLGGRQGNGDQMFSWIQIDDLYKIILFIKSNKNLEGVFNCSSPNPIANRTLMKTLREIMNIKIGLPSPVWLLEIGAHVIKTEPELVLKSRWVIPEKLLAAGYNFEFPTIQSAIKNILNKNN